MNHIPKASIVIPAYNEEARIAMTLKAATGQDFPEDFEVIVVDNASSDNTGEIAGSFGGVKVVREDRKGVQFARERGRKEANGEIIAYLDADCLPDKGWLEKGVSFFGNPKVAGVSGPADYYDLPKFTRYAALWFQKIFYRLAHFLIHEVTGRGGVMLFGNSFMRASTLEAAGGINTEIVFYGDDTDMAKRLSRQGSLLYRNEITVKTSGRRFKQMGVLRTLFIYILNFLWVTIFKKPFSQR